MPTQDVRRCKACRRVIAERFSFDICTPCSLKQLNRNPALRKWRAEKKKAARERLAALRKKKALEKEEQ